jgi:predicted MFS family arabinose efflux permease
MAKTIFEALGGSLRLLASRRFGTFLIASFLSNVGSWAQTVAEPWLLLTLGASSFLIGLDSFAMSAPVWALTLVGGLLADRSDRRRVIAVFQSLQMLCPATIVALLLLDELRPWMVIVLSLVIGITDALSMPSFQSIVPSIVARDEIDRGIALNSIQFNLSRILGPALAGLLMVSFGAIACFVASVASYLPFIGVALWILPARAAATPRAAIPALDRPWSGTVEILRQPRLLGALMSALATNLFCAPLMVFVPVLVRNGLHGDAHAFSRAVAAFGAGGILGALCLLGVPGRIDRRHVGVATGLAYAAAVIATALSASLATLPVLMFVAGASMSASGTAANTMLQSSVRPELLGQSSSLWMLAMRGGIAIGALSTGAAVSLLGVRSALLADGCLGIAVQALVGVYWLRAERPIPSLHATD